MEYIDDTVGALEKPLQPSKETCKNVPGCELNKSGCAAEWWSKQFEGKDPSTVSLLKCL